MQISRSDIEELAAIIVKELLPFLIKKRWLSLREAAAEFTIGENKLKRMAKVGIIKGFQDPDSKRNDWIFDRKSLDAYRERQAGGVISIEEKILALKAKMTNGRSRGKRQ